MSGFLQVLTVAVLVFETLAIGQGSDIARVLGEVRDALGGTAKLSAVKTMLAEGTRNRTMPDGQVMSSRFEVALALPGRFARKDVVGNINGMEITRITGLRDGEYLEKTDAPPGMGGGSGAVVVRMGPEGAMGPGASPEALAAARARQLAGAKKDFARLALGLFGSGLEAFPLEFGYGGTAESPDSKAHVLTVTGPDGFEAKLFVDVTSHLPLMLSWMDLEPLVMTSGGPGAGAVQVRTPEDMERLRRELDERRRQAEANRRTVEHRLDYRTLAALFDQTPGLVADKLKAVLEAVWQGLRAQGVRGLIFAYDEAQTLADHAERDEHPLSLLLDVFQSIQKKGIPFMLVLSGLPTLFPKLVDARTFAERMFRVVFLDRLDEKDSHAALRVYIASACSTVTASSRPSATPSASTCRVTACQIPSSGG